MRLFVPNYYDSFRCIAERCRHNCCIGWEIDIDPDTLELYEDIGGDFGLRIKSAISYDGEPHFILKENDRCPFLNEKGLCDIITELGDGALCDICADHPRYRNYVGDDLEMGLGLCCEEAARLILSQKEKVCLIDADTGNAAPLSDERRALLLKLQDRTLPFKSRISSLFTPDLADAFEFLSSLERLDPSWENYLAFLKEENAELSGYDNELEQLAVYFFLRHGAQNPEAGLRFAIYSVSVIEKIAAAIKRQKGDLDFDTLADVCRMYSSEIEYSDTNTEEVVNRLNNE